MSTLTKNTADLCYVTPNSFGVFAGNPTDKDYLFKGLEMRSEFRVFADLSPRLQEMLLTSRRTVKDTSWDDTMYQVVLYFEGSNEGVECTFDFVNRMQRVQFMQAIEGATGEIVPAPPSTYSSSFSSRNEDENYTEFTASLFKQIEEHVDLKGLTPEEFMGKLKDAVVSSYVSHPFSVQPYA